MITFILLGNNITRIPNLGKLLKVDRSLPTSEALCFARINAAYKVETRYFSILDGGEDILLDNFERVMLSICDRLDETNLDIGSAKHKCINGKNSFMQHAVVCRTSAFKKLNLPHSGCFHFEPMVYGMLSENGTVEWDEEVYEWIPSKDGASTWLDMPLARINGIRWAKNLPPLIVSNISNRR